ncbi:MAG: DUF6161 domain-containing protein [Sphingopyxis sp.]
MTEEFHRVELGGQEPLVFPTRRHFANWLREELKIWNWLWTDEENGGYDANAPAPIRTAYKALNNGVGQLEDESQAGTANIRTWFGNYLPGNESVIFVSASENGRRILAAKDRVGIAEARIMYCYLRSPSDWQQHANTPVGLRALMIAADAGSIDRAGLVKELEQERTNYRSAITRLENRVRELEQQSRDAEAARSRRVRSIIRRLRDSIKAKSETTTLHFAATSQEAITKLLETEDKFRRQMELAAPVEYWKGKAADHGKSERTLLKVTAGYFLTAAVIIGGAGWAAAQVILSLDKSVTDRTPVYLITSGALLAITTLVFWIGRLVVKLWLSEHHLRVDAKERAIMTQAFLAMSENDAMAEADRAIMLASIFRPAPDGVVKEEGPQDIGLQALLSRLLAK